MMRIDVIKNAVKTLEDEGFNILLYNSSVVDLAAQKKELKFLIKVFENIDHIKPNQAVELKKLSKCLDASPVIIGAVSKTGKLAKDSVYDRYGIPTMTVPCFRNCLEEVFPRKIQSKGRQIVKIHGELVKQQRADAGLTMRQLSDKLGVTKDALYMYEAGRINPRFEIAKQIEETLKVPVIKKESPFNVPDEKFIDEVYSDDLHKKLLMFDFDLYDFNKMNFDTLLKDKKNKAILEMKPEEAGHARQFSDFFKAMFAVISDDKKCKNAIPKEDILETDSKKEFIKLLKDKTEK